MKYSDLVVVNSQHKALQLSTALNKLPKSEQRDHFAGTQLTGYFYLFRDPKVDPNVVMECVVSRDGDAITSLYVNHAINSERNALVRAREEIIRDLARKIGLSPENVGIEDEARGRPLGLSELSTGQLIDLLAEKMGKTIITTDGHAAGVEPGVLTVQADGSIKVVQ